MLLSKMKKVINDYEYADCTSYNATDYGLTQVLNTWQENKNNLIELFKKHPNYNGNYQIILTEDYQREIDSATINDMLHYFLQRLQLENYEYIHDFKMFLRWFMFENKTQYIDKNIVTAFNDYELSARYGLKIHEGSKTSKTLKKWLQNFESIKNDVNFEKQYAKLSDALNPVTITRYTILSVNPIDYLLMSNGNSWSSCHTIDKVNGSYQGCYSSGTLSYMLDSTSFIFYTIDKDSNIENPELEKKITRQVYNYYDGALLQGRLYPQCNDGENGLYKQNREIVQRVISECENAVNLWNNKKGTQECKDNTESAGTHYRDYYYQSECNISYRQNQTEFKKIKIGHNPICVCCGNEFYEEECIQCESCREEEQAFAYCEHCESYIDENDNYILTADGRYYCCEECANNANYYQCEDDGEYYHVDDMFWDEYNECFRLWDNWPVIDTDYGYFKDEDDARDYGLVYTEDNETWQKEDECYKYYNEDEYYYYKNNFDEAHENNEMFIYYDEYYSRKNHFISYDEAIENALIFINNEMVISENLLKRLSNNNDLYRVMH